MAKINSTNIGEEMQRVFKTKSGDSISPIISEIITPTYEVEKRESDVQTTAIIASGSSGITLQTDRESYLSYMLLSHTHSAACDITNYYVNLTTASGEAKQFIFYTTTLTLTNTNTYLEFPIPIRLQKGSVISIIGTFAAGTSTTYLNVGLAYGSRQ